jgi:cyclase
MMKTDKIAEAVQQARLPTRTYRDRMTLTLGGKEIQIIHTGKGHTRGDSIVFVPADRIVYVSELFFYDRFPWANTGYAHWIDSIDTALKLDADIFVPGQGPARWGNNPKLSREAFIKARNVLIDFRDAVQKEIAAGATEEQTVARVLLPQHKNLGSYDQQREVVVRRMYQDLTGKLQ